MKGLPFLILAVISVVSVSGQYDNSGPPGSENPSGVSASSNGDVEFKKSMVWGTATSAYQIEGGWNASGRTPSIWDTFCHEKPSPIYDGETGNVADDHFHRYKEDIALMASAKLTHYRFSVSWSRVMTDGLTPNEEGIQFYRDLIDELKAHKIEPVLTMYHWDLPQLLQDWGGWLNTSSQEWFVTYATLLYDRFGDDVEMWLTFNEPWTFLWLGYGVGSFAPGRCSDRNNCAAGNTSTEPYIGGHNVLLAHAKAVAAFRNSSSVLSPNAKIGITLNCDWAAPLTDSDDDVAAAQRRTLFALGWFADPIAFGDYPAVMRSHVGSRLPNFTDSEKELLIGSQDFFGLNHYTTMYAYQAPIDHAQGWQGDMGVATTYQKNGKDIGAPAESSWLYVVPWGFKDLLMWVDARYGANGQAIYVTENGVDVPGEANMKLKEALADEFRINYYHSYLTNMAEAMSEGVNVAGYFAWSFMDNFEWVDGYSKRFGLVHIDYANNLTRIPKDSWSWYSQLAQTNTLPDVPQPKVPPYNAPTPANWAVIMAICGAGLIVVVFAGVTALMKYKEMAAESEDDGPSPHSPLMGVGRVGSVEASHA